MFEPVQVNVVCVGNRHCNYLYYVDPEVLPTLLP